MRYLDGDEFACALVSGIHRLIDEQDLLNRINVFPVADGDTGTNLSLSLGSVLPLLEREQSEHLGTLLASIADTLLDASRGNSGAIMAQFFQGVSDAAGEINRFTTYTFSKAVMLGRDYAHDAMAKPQEGTILSAIAAFSVLGPDDRPPFSLDADHSQRTRRSCRYCKLFIGETQPFETICALRGAALFE